MVDDDKLKYLKKWLKKECKKRLYGIYRPICVVPYIMEYKCDRCRYYHRNIGKNIVDELEFNEDELQRCIKKYYGEELYEWHLNEMKEKEE